MKEYDKLKHNLKTFIVEYFSTKGIEADPQVYEGKISEDIYYKQTLIYPLVPRYLYLWNSLL